MSGKVIPESMKMGNASAAIVKARHSCSDDILMEQELTIHMGKTNYEPIA